MKGGRFILFLAYLILGLYFINPFVGLINLPDSFEKINHIIIFIGGLFLLYGAFSTLTRKKRIY